MYSEGLSEDSASLPSVDCRFNVHLGNLIAGVNDFAARFMRKYASCDSHRQVLVRDFRIAAARV